MFTRSIEINPEYLPAYINRSAIYIEMGKYYEAIADLDFYILNNDKNGLAYLNRGIANENTFRWKEACRDWKKAMDLGVSKAQKYIEEQCKE
jgi:tetratricopeptide (TPR) repeat protein